MRNKIAVIPIILLLVIAVLLPACAPKGETTKLTYTIADYTGDWGYPSPHCHYSRGPGYIRMSFIFDTLVWKDKSGFVPALAEEWQYLEDENAYLFKLRKNATWHDGTKFTARDVKFTIDYVREHPYPFVTLIGPSGVKEAKIIDDYTIKLYLEQPYAPFLNDVAGTLPILPRHIWENVDQPEKFTDPKAVIGTGPYKLVDYSREHGTYLYEAYDNYYLGKPEIEQVKFVKVNEEMIPAALKNGSVNAGDIPPELVTDMEANGFTVLRCPYSWNAKLMINHRKEPLSRKEFRQALAYAIDREELVQITQRGYALAGSPGMVPSDSPWFCPDVEQYKYNPEKAKELLEGLGYKLENGYFVKDGEELILQLIAPPSLGFKDVGEFIKGQLEGIGIKVNFTTLEASTLDAKVLNWQFDLAIYGHGGLFEPSILNRVILGEGFNSARYHENQTLNQLLEAQLREMNPEKRKDLVCQIQQIYAEEIPALTLYYPDWYWAHDGSIELYYTQGGVASGIPIALNKMAFLR